MARQSIFHVQPMSASKERVSASEAFTRRRIWAENGLKQLLPSIHTRLKADSRENRFIAQYRGLSIAALSASVRSSSVWRADFLVTGYHHGHLEMPVAVQTA